MSLENRLNISVKAKGKPTPTNRFLQFPVDLVTFTEEILNVKLPFLCSVYDILRKNITDNYLACLAGSTTN